MAASRDNRLLTDEEINSIGQRTVDAITEAIDAGDLDRAKDLAQRMHRESLAMHDGLRDWMTSLFSFIGRRYGDEVLYDALKDSIGAWIKPLIDVYSKADPHRRALMHAKILRGHLVPFRVEEDDEKFTFILNPCSTGGRMVLEGKYASPHGFLKVKNAQAMTFGKEDFPVYCCHCPFQEILPQEIAGYPLFITVPPERPGEEPCRIHLYKDPKAAPRHQE
ncbi:hypothetical protein ACFLWX_00405 [Chloroflexota bacterium]